MPPHPRPYRINATPPTLAAHLWGPPAAMLRPPTHARQAQRAVD